jgi:hypothetical protein
VERFLQASYKPHLLSTYALTLYKHTYKADDGTQLPVGESRNTKLKSTIQQLAQAVLAAVRSAEQALPAASIAISSNCVAGTLERLNTIQCSKLLQPM